MVQIVQSGKRSTGGERFLEGLSQSAPDALQRFFDERTAKQASQDENTRLENESEAAGLPRNVISPELRRGLLDERGEQQKNAAKLNSEAKEADQEEGQTKVIENVFGPTAAKLWKTFPTGARTEITKAMLDAKFRGKSSQEIEQMLAGAAQQNVKKAPQEQNQPGSGFQLPESIEPPKDLKPSELPAWRESRRKENAPVYQEAQSKAKAADKEATELRILQKINESGKLPEGLSRLMINPETNEPYGIVQLANKVPPAVQRWVKTINDFTTRAKDSYGSRVTNFDLQQFMRRLPGLLNSPEGRKDIIHQMQVLSDLNSLHEGSLVNIYQKYGVGNIEQEQADQLATQMNKETEEMLREELDNIDSRLDERELSDILTDESRSQEFDEMPDASHYPAGTPITNEETGEQFESDGKKWVKVK